MNRLLMVFLFAAIGQLSTLAQQPELIPDNFRLTGDAIATGENCFRLTPAIEWKGGTIWYKDALDLRHPFEIKLRMKFGCKDHGADGIVFILHPQLLTGQEGEGMGFGGLSPSFGMEMDTYQNYHLNDPAYDHIALIKNGSVDHAQGIGKPAPIFANKSNIENCDYHNIHISWNPDFNNFRFSINGNIRLNINYDIIGNIFNANPNVFWGFSSATGGEHNEHIVCLEKIAYEAVSQLDLKTISSIVDGQREVLFNVTFDPPAKALSKEALPELDKLANLMNRYPEYVLSIHAHTDDTDTRDNSHKHSKARGELVKEYLLLRGIEAKRIQIFGMGEDFPIAPNDTEAGRKKNNRIEVSMEKDRV